MGKPIKPIQKAPIEFAGREFSCLKYWQSASAVKVNLSGRRLIFRSPVSINSGSFRASVEAAGKGKERGGCCREYADSNLESNRLYDEIQKSADFGRRKILGRVQRIQRE
jgi:hypothetical protein